MVSMLSSRLLQNAPNKSIASHMHSPANSTLVNNQHRKRVSGYSADGEGAKLISFAGDIRDEKQKRAHEVEALARKRKLADINYDVANARADIAKAGLSCPPGLVGRSRALPPGSVPMDSVTLILSKDYDKMSESPRMQGSTFSPKMARIYSELVHSCRHHYKSSSKRVSIPPEQNTQNTEGSMDTPTTYSLSDTDSDDNNEVSIPPRLDGSIDGDDNSADKILKDDSILPPINNCQLSISFEQAVSYSPLARMIVQADAPFKIVFSNAAYTRLTGSESHLIVGRPLCENGLFDMDPETIYETCLSCKNHEVWAFTSTNSMHKKTNNAPRPKIKCLMTVRAIHKDNRSISMGNEMTESGIRTHFCLDIEAFQGNKKSEAESSISCSKSGKEKEHCTMKMMA